MLLTSGKINQYRKSWAVMIGIKEYSSSDEMKLDNAVNDANELASLLKEIGFDEIKEIYDKEATKERIMSFLMDDLINKVEGNDRVLIFFSGHAITHINKGDHSKSGYII